MVIGPQGIVNRPTSYKSSNDYAHTPDLGNRNRKGEPVMASNFKIAMHRNSENLHLKLIGDFDGTSAHELLNVLNKNCKGTSRVFIHTGSLKNIYDFGCNVFHKNLDLLNGRSVPLVFTGEKAGQLATGIHPYCSISS
jgi:anti-anti-sigma regulatory factor